MFQIYTWFFLSRCIDSVSRLRSEMIQRVASSRSVPRETLCFVVSYLQLPDYAALAQVCKTLNYLVQFYCLA
jgi:hypothetical protein